MKKFVRSTAVSHVAVVAACLIAAAFPSVIFVFGSIHTSVPNSLPVFFLSSPTKSEAKSKSHLALDSFSASASTSAWLLDNLNSSISSIPAEVPGNVYLDLERAGIINSSLYRFNEMANRWLAFEPAWRFKSSVLLPFSPAEFDCVELIFDGVDTVSKIFVNQTLLGRTENEHRQYIFDLTSLLKWGSGERQGLQGSASSLQVGSSFELVVEIESPVNYAKSRLSLTPYSLPVSDPDLNLPFRNGIRKAQSDFGWDWGLGTAGSGIYKSVYILPYNGARLSDLVVDSYLLGALPVVDPFTSKLEAIQIPLQSPLDAYVNVTAFIRLPSKLQKYEGQLTLKIENTSCAASIPVSLLAPASSSSSFLEFAFSLGCRLEKPFLWWPVGLSSSHFLYSLSVELVPNNPILFRKTNSQSQMTRRIGIRSVEIVRDPLPDGSAGLTMFFRINGLPVFLKGSNVIPFDAFPTRASAADIISILTSALNSNQNVVRIWGGGLFQIDELYDFADESGLLVWQEFAFACAMYERNAEFLANVAAEVSYQTRRLASHASIVVFGGNNENEVALTWFAETNANPRLYTADYVKLYIDTVRHVFYSLVNGSNVPFLTSSPTRGPLVEDFHSDFFVGRWADTGSPSFGDVHFYDYNDDCADAQIYPRAKFVSEFGFQSHPSLFSYMDVSDAEAGDWSWDSPLMQFRQRHAGGNEQLRDQLQRQFLFPNKSFDDFLYLTQVVQAICYRTALSAWRRWKQEPSAFTYGTLYWQLNDVWPAPTWSSLEYGGRWKLVHYAIRQVYSSVFLSASYNSDGSTLVAYLTSDLYEALTGEIEVRLVRYADSVSWTASTFQIPRIYALGSVLFASVNVDSLLADNCTRSSCFVLFLARLKTLSDKDVAVPRLPFYLCKLRDAALAPANFSVVLQPATPSSATVVIQSSAVSPFVWMESRVNGVFSFNGDLLLANEEVKAEFKANHSFDWNTFKDSFKIRTIQSTL